MTDCPNGHCAPRALMASWAMGSERSTAARMSPRARRRRNGQRDDTEFESEGSEPTGATDAVLDMQRAAGNKAVTQALQNSGAVTISREVGTLSAVAMGSAPPSSYGSLDDATFNADTIAHDLLRAIDQNEHNFVPDANYQSNVELERRKVDVPKVIAALENLTASQVAEVERRYLGFEGRALSFDLFEGGQSGRQTSMTPDQRARISVLLKGTKGEPIPGAILEDLKKFPPAMAVRIRAAVVENSNAAASLVQLEADAIELHELLSDDLDEAKRERVMVMHRRSFPQIDAMDAFYDHRYGPGKLVFDFAMRLQGLQRMRMTELREGNWAQADACAIEDKRRQIEALNKQDEATSSGVTGFFVSAAESLDSAGLGSGGVSYLRDQRKKKRAELTGGIEAIVEMNRREALEDPANAAKSSGEAVAERLQKILGQQDGEAGNTLGSQLTKTLGTGHGAAIAAAGDLWNTVSSSSLVEQAAQELLAMENDHTTKSEKIIATMQSFRKVAQHDLIAVVHDPSVPIEQKQEIARDQEGAVTGLAQKYIARYRDAYDRIRGERKPFDDILASADSANTTYMKDLMVGGGRTSDLGEMQHAMGKEDIAKVKEILRRQPNREALDELVASYNKLGEGKDLLQELFGRDYLGQTNVAAAMAAPPSGYSKGLVTKRDAEQVFELLQKPKADDLAGTIPKGMVGVPLEPGKAEVDWLASGGKAEYEITMMHKGATGTLREIGDNPETENLLDASNDKLPKLAAEWAAEQDPIKKQHLLLEIRKTRATLSGDADAYEKDNERVLGEIRGALSFAVSIALAIAIPGAGAGLVAFLETTAINIAANVAANVVIKGGDYGWADLQGDLLGGVLGAAGGKFGEAVLGKVAATIIGPTARATVGAAEKAGITTILGKEVSGLATAGEKAVIGVEEFEAKAAGQEVANVLAKEGEAAVATGVGKEAGAVAGDVGGAEAGVVAKAAAAVPSGFEKAAREIGGFFGGLEGGKLPSGDLSLSFEEILKALVATGAGKAAHHEGPAGKTEAVPGEPTPSGPASQQENRVGASEPGVEITPIPEGGPIAEHDGPVPGELEGGAGPRETESGARPQNAGGPEAPGSTAGAGPTVSGGQASASARLEARALVNLTEQLGSRWPDLPVEARLAELSEIANRPLRARGIPEVKFVEGQPGEIAKGNGGHFDSTKWAVVIDPATMLRGSLPPELVEYMAGFGRHEVEHTMQWWSMAKELAGQGLDAPAIAKAMELGGAELNPDIAQHAVDVVAGQGPSGPAETAAARTWWGSVYDPQSARGPMLEQRRLAHEALAGLDAQIAAGGANPDPALVAARDQLRPQVEHLDQLYKALPEEVGAYGAEGVVRDQAKVLEAERQADLAEIAVEQLGQLVESIEARLFGENAPTGEAAERMRSSRARAMDRHYALGEAAAVARSARDMLLQLMGMSSAPTQGTPGAANAGNAPAATSAQPTGSTPSVHGGGGPTAPTGGGPGGTAAPPARLGAPATSEVTLEGNELRAVGSWDEHSHATVETHGTDDQGVSAGWKIEDVNRGTNPGGSGAEMVVQVGRQTGVDRPGYLLGEVGNQPTRDVVAQGLPPDGSVLGNLRQRIAQELGGQAQPSTWADEAGNPISPQEAQTRLAGGEPVYLRTDITYPAGTRL